MDYSVMGKVIVTAKIESLEDLYKSESGVLPIDQVRTVEGTDALMDTGASALSMPKRLIAQLGLITLHTRKARTSAGPVTLQVFGTVRLSIQGRECPCDVVELPDDCPVLVGQLPLEAMDWVVDCANQRLIGNPAHGGEEMYESFLLD